MAYYGFLNGQICPVEQLAIGATDLGLLRGYGLFDYFRTYNGRPFQWDWYWQRFMNSAAMLHMTVPIQKDEAYRTVMTLIEKSGGGDVGVRFVLTGGYSPDSISVLQPNLMMMAEELPPAAHSQHENGIKVILDEYVREMAEVKTTDYKRVIMLATAIQAAKAQDVLYHKNGEISELSRSNVFLLNGNRLITPNRHILHGITRKTVLQLAKADFVIEERPVLLSELYDADEVFTTSSTKQVLPITQIGDLTIADGRPGERTKYLHERFEELVSNW
ncbi:aminotransferase class IV [Tellurirhabdus rosea]|uniref:aminotransferase class IV n=1 Tax=Tellurirhabdus rosea TaxID=2674997 RepID=UPI00225A0844|nr:aminotransferase class IV [Tellurirhabdus rosea]